MTPTGRAVLAGSLVLLAVGAVLGPEPAGLGLAGLAALAVAALFVVGRTDPLVERRVAPVRVTVGDLAEGHVTVTNTGRRPLPAATAIETVGDGSTPLAVPRLGPGQAVTLTHRLPTDRRAVVTVGPLTLRRSDPFGLLARTNDDPAGAERLWVHPRVHPLQPLPQAHRRDQEGLTEGSQNGDRIFHALREYVVGDDLRRVHWKATAHRGTLMVREHVDPAQPDTTVLLDDRASALDAERFELAVEIAASVLFASAGRGFPVRLRSVSGHLAATDTSADRMALLDLLAGADRQPATDDPDGDRAGLTHETRHAAGRALVIVTGDPDADTLAQVGLAARRADTVVVISVVAPSGRPGAGGGASERGAGGPPEEWAPGDPPGPAGAGVPATGGTTAAAAGVTVLAVHDLAGLARAWDGLR